MDKECAGAVCHAHVGDCGFVSFVSVLARLHTAEAQNCPKQKRRRDLRQADIVQSLLDNGLLVLAAGKQ